MTVALCTQACQTEGYVLAGVEYSGECYCGNTASNGGGPAPDGLSGCNMACNGNSSEYCGGPNRLDVYGYGQKSIIAPAWSALGKYRFLRSVSFTSFYCFTRAFHSEN